VTSEAPLCNGREVRVLVVDDEVPVRTTLAANLELEGFSVVDVASAAEALEHLSRGTFDLVITDVRMPGMHGVDLFRKIRAAWPALPVVLMSGFAVEQLIEDAVREGAFTVLWKPFDVEGMLELVRRAARHPFVLVVDGEGETAESAASALRTAGVRAEVAQDAPAALRMVAEGGTDVAVVDLVMKSPDDASLSTGASLIDALVKVDPTLAVIAVASPSAASPARASAAKSAYACIAKPVSTDALVATVARARGRTAR
jgi:DNA-binding NtrC family response regulator